MDQSSINILIIAVAALVAISIVAMAVCIVQVGRVAFHNSSPSAAASFGLLFLALPSLSTIVLIVMATAVLTSLHILPPDGCIAIFSGVASYVLGAQTEKRKGAEASLPGGRSARRREKQEDAGAEVAADPQS